MKSFKTLMEELSHIEKATAKLKKIKKGTEVSFTDQQTRKKVTGQYGGLKRLGAYSYAKVNTDKMTHAVPVHHIHQTQD